MQPLICCWMLQEVDLMELPTNARSELWRWGGECNKSIQNLAVRSWKFTPQALEMEKTMWSFMTWVFAFIQAQAEIVWKLMAKWAALQGKLCCDRQVARTVWGRGTFQWVKLQRKMRAGSRGILGVRWKICHLKCLKPKVVVCHSKYLNLHVSCLYPSIYCLYSVTHRCNFQ